MRHESMFTGILSIVAEEAGEEAARKLAAAKGGGRCYIPAQARDGHWLTELVGQEAAEAICRAIGGGEVEIPLGGAGSLQQARRNAQRRAHELLERGWSTDSVARAVGVDRSTVKRWRRNWREAQAQPGLFDWREKQSRRQG